MGQQATFAQTNERRCDILRGRRSGTFEQTADPRMCKSPSLVAAALALGMSVALADPLAGEKKAELCVLCHRVDNTHAAPVLDGLPANYLFEQFEYYKSGKRFGPAMQTNLAPFSDQDRQDIADYFSSRPAIRAVTNVNADKDLQQLGSTTANDLGCASCHGPSYRGTKEVPRLAGQLKVYLALHIGRLQRDSSLHPSMSSSGKSIPQSAIEAMATYFASLEP
jgi:cytochrome c553